MTNRYVHNYRLPDVFSILIIDDKINELNIAYQNCFEACLNALNEKGEGECKILIDYAEGIDLGFQKWRCNSYDLVLIDYDFKKNIKELPAEQESESSDTKLDLSHIFPEKQGIELLRLFVQLRQGVYKYRSPFQKLFLWTSHRIMKGDGRGVDSELNKKEIKEYYLKKDDEKDIQCILEQIKSSRKYSEEFVLERLVFLFQTGRYNLNGYVALKKDGFDGKMSYPSLCRDIPIYLLPYKPDPGKFDYRALDELESKAKEKEKLNGTKLLKFLKGLRENESRCKRFMDSDINELKGTKDIYFIKGEKINQVKTTFAGIEFASDIWLAPTPLTMVTRVGSQKDVFNLLINKLEAFFEIGIGAAVLKTTYLESEGIEWPEDHIQRHHRTRVFINPDSYSFWNTGKTKLESFPPQMLNRFLLKVKKDKPEWGNRIIVSLGIKLDNEIENDKSNFWDKSDVKSWGKKWTGFFERVFKGIDKNCFPLIEINVRHFLRPLLKHYLLGDEYFAPLCKDKIEKYKIVLRKFKTILTALNAIGAKFEKKLILKFPFRSDIMPFLLISQEIGNKTDNYGVKGVTLINTAKSPYPYQIDKRLMVTEDSDKIKVPQLSGELLAWLRNFILCKLAEAEFKLDISVSGGVAIGADDINYLRNLKFVKSIQLGTKIIKDIRQLKDVNKAGATTKFLQIKKETDLSSRIIHFVKDKCRKCGRCYNSLYCDAFLNRGIDKDEFPLIDVTACTGCGLCVQNCLGEIKSGDPALEIVPANKYVILCSPFSESLAFILRENKIPFMFMFMTADEDDISIKTELTRDIAEHAKRLAEERAIRCYKKSKREIKKRDGELNPLEHSIFLGVKTYVLGQKEKCNGYKIIGVPKDEAEVRQRLEGYASFKAITAYACLKDGAVYENRHVESKEFVLSSIEEYLGEYLQYGVEKAGGIDILGHGEILFRDREYSENDIMTFAGLPLEAVNDLHDLLAGKNKCD